MKNIFYIKKIIALIATESLNTTECSADNDWLQSVIKYREETTARDNDDNEEMIEIHSK